MIGPFLQEFFDSRELTAGRCLHVHLCMDAASSKEKDRLLFCSKRMICVRMKLFGNLKHITESVDLWISVHNPNVFIRGVPKSLGSFVYLVATVNWCDFLKLVFDESLFC